MLHAAHRSIRDADLVLHLHPLGEAPAPPLKSLLPAGTLRAPVLTVLTKADQAPAALRRAAGGPSSPGGGVFVVSSLSGEGTGQLLEEIRRRLPEGPFLHDPDDVGAQPLRFFVAEFVREAAFAELEQELPYSVAVEIDEFREDSDPLYIRATIGVERESQKPIVLGRGGRVIKAIGTAARQRAEAFLDRRVRLELWVAVWPRWRRNRALLSRLGLPLPPE
jgi:GTP-binding protein Era